MCPYEGLRAILLGGLSSPRKDIFMKVEDQIKQLRTKVQIRQEEIDKVLAKRTTGSRARAAYDFWLRLNPKHRISYSDGTTASLTAKQIHAETLKKVKYLKELQRNKFGTNESGSMRLALELPPDAMNFIQLFHPDIFYSDDYAKTRFRKLVKEFKEFQIMEAI